jgi:hypothetical protein
MSQPPSETPPGFGPPPGSASANAPTQSLPLIGSPPDQPAPIAPQAPPAAPVTPAASTNTSFPAPPRPDAARHRAVWAFGLVSLAATVIGLSVEEDGRNFWDSVNAWGGLAILGAVLTLAPVLRSTLNLSAHRAWQVAAAGAGALGLFWVLFVLPAAGSNTSFVTTIGAAAGFGAVWIAPGRETESGPQPQVW